MARLVFPTANEWEVLERLGLAGDLGDEDEVVLISPAIANRLRGMGSTPRRYCERLPRRPRV